MDSSLNLENQFEVTVLDVVPVTVGGLFGSGHSYAEKRALSTNPCSGFEGVGLGWRELGSGGSLDGVGGVANRGNKRRAGIVGIAIPQVLDREVSDAVVVEIKSIGAVWYDDLVNRGVYDYRFSG